MEIEVVQRALERERKRREAAEALLEEKSRELYHSYKDLESTLEELQENKDKLVQSEKMASLGVMSAGIAHEINNPIGFVQSNLNTLGEYAPIFAHVVEQTRKLMAESTQSDTAVALKKYLEEEDIEFVLEDSNDILQESRSGIERVRDIVSGLKTFAHLDAETLVATNINDIIENTLTIVRGQYKHHCEFIADLSELPTVTASSGSLGQVFMNLLVNAAQATEEGTGIVKIDTSVADRFVCIKVQDNGCGISDDHLKKLFEPFFTTKDVGEGTGLGLSISLGIIEDHKGTIECQSEVGNGTTFTVQIPIDADAA